MSVDQEDHVHFSTAAENAGDGSIRTEKVSTDEFVVRLGFLQQYHRYSVTYTVSVDDLITESTILEDMQKNLNVQMIEYRKLDENRLELTVTFFSHRHGVVREEHSIQVGPANAGRQLNFVYYARVIGRGKGTPSLLNGVRCIGIEDDDDDSMASDAQY